MQEQDKLNWFILGLQSWAQSEVERSNPGTLEDAYVVAECLADTQRKSYTNAFKPSKKPDHGGKKDDRRERKDEPSTQHQAERRTFFCKSDNSQNRVTKCWFCDGNHLAKQCPKRINRDNQASSSRHSANAAQVEEGEAPKMGALQLLNTIKREEKAKVTATPFNELMYLEILVNGRPAMAMVDSGATHNFVSVEEARRLGLTLEKGELRMKAVNSEAQPIHGVARDAVVKVESWSGRVNFSVVPMDDFRMILGLELLNTAKMVPMPHLHCIVIMDEKSPCMVPVTSMKRNKGKAAMISALQLKKGLKHGEETYLVAIREVTNDSPGLVPEALAPQILPLVEC
ncbi:hypothetical protein EJ110_NYTH60137 [Nymphaea thermarum]|nr:hypothetical protein EJ110_NYTH60137 [Nymphaea thermarum]